MSALSYNVKLNCHKQQALKEKKNRGGKREGYKKKREMQNEKQLISKMLQEFFPN